MAAQLKTLWDSWTEANAALGAPAVKRQLKSMWMSSGGTNVAESKKLKKITRVAETRRAPVKKWGEK